MGITRRSNANKLRLIILLIFGICFPAFANNSSFIELSFAFSFGISTTFFIAIILLKQSQLLKWSYPFIALLALTLILLGSVSSLPQTLLSCCAVLFVLLLSVWPLNLQQTLTNKRYQVYFYSAFFFAATTLVALLVLPTSYGLMLWLSFAAIALTFQALTIALLTKKLEEQFVRLTLQWLMLGGFSTMYYHWLIKHDSITELAAFAVLSYFFALINALFYSVKPEDDQLCLPSGAEKQPRKIDSKFSYTHDHATQLPSYQQTLTRLKSIFQQSEERKYAIIVFKPINFQQVNSVLGHHNSDILLLQLAYCLQQHLEENELLVDFEASDQVSRIGKLQGLNFIVAFDVTNLRHPEKEIIEFMCQQITQAVPNAMSFKSFSLNFELAFGVALSTTHSQHVDQVISHAGDALLEAESKEQGISYFDDSQISYTEQQLSKMEMLKADIAAEKLQWLVQPQIDVKDRSLKGFELLVFWQYKDEKPQELQSFVSLAEYSGEIHLLTRLMLKEAFSILAKLQSRGLEHPVSVNLASKHILETDLIDFIEQQRLNYDVSVNNLVIELTEPVLLSASEKAKQIIDQLRSLGIKISIDDFSGSYESLRYVRKMSINQVKVDCQKLKEKEENRVDKAIINALINLSRTMRLPLVGVGVDTHEIERVFSSIGGAVMQGDTINRGVLLNELDDWIVAWFDESPISVDMPVSEFTGTKLPRSLLKK